MTGFLDQFRKNVISSVWKDKTEEPKVKDINDKIALGVLLWVVAEADEKFLPLFRVACADKDLDNDELEIIRKISGLFQIAHKDFIDAKIRVKKEFGLDTAGY